MLRPDITSISSSSLSRLFVSDIIFQKDVRTIHLKKNSFVCSIRSEFSSTLRDIRLPLLIKLSEIIALSNSDYDRSSRDTARWYAFQSWIWLSSRYKLLLAGTLILRRTIPSLSSSSSKSFLPLRAVECRHSIVCRELDARSIKLRRRRYPCAILNDIDIATVFYEFPLKSPPGKDKG